MPESKGLRSAPNQENAFLVKLGRDGTYQWLISPWNRAVSLNPAISAWRMLEKNRRPQEVWRGIGVTRTAASGAFMLTFAGFAARLWRTHAAAKTTVRASGSAP